MVLTRWNETQICAFQYHYTCRKKAGVDTAVSSRAFDGHLFSSYQYYTLLDEVSGAACVEIRACGDLHKNSRWVRSFHGFHQASASNGAFGGGFDD